MSLPYLNLEEVAESHGLSVDKVCRLVEANRLPLYHVVCVVGAFRVTAEGIEDEPTARFRLLGDPAEIVPTIHDAHKTLPAAVKWMNLPEGKQFVFAIDDLAISPSPKWESRHARSKPRSFAVKPEELSIALTGQRELPLNSPEETEEVEPRRLNNLLRVIAALAMEADIDPESDKAAGVIERLLSYAEFESPKIKTIRGILADVRGLDDFQGLAKYEEAKGTR